MKHESFNKPKRSKKSRKSKNDIYSNYSNLSNKSFSFGKESDSEQSEQYWRSITPELSERCIMEPGSPEKAAFVPSPKGNLSRISFGSASIISEAKGVFSAKDRESDDLMLKEIQTIRKRQEIQQLKINHNK